MKLFDWLLNLLGWLVMAAIVLIVVMGLNQVHVSLNEAGRNHSLQPR